MACPFSRIALTIALLTFPGSAAIAAPTRFPVTLADVAAALAEQRPDLATSALDVPSMTAATRDPELVVEALRPSGRNATEVRMACRHAADCLPFYVRVRGSASGLASNPASNSAAGSGLATVALVPAGRPHAGSRSEAPAAVRTMPAVRSGARATLHIDSGRLHIILPVICLQSGSVGGDVRVTGLDHRITYTAHILSATLMQGSL